MNRPIKFRAWDVFYSKFIYSGEGEGALSNFFAKVAGGEAAKREVPLMQFTGLLDKNGKEIYEGDIIKSGNGRSWEVKYGHFVAKGYTTLPFFGWYLEGEGNQLPLDASEEDEVIGNIKEPGLLPLDVAAAIIKKAKGENL